LKGGIGLFYREDRFGDSESDESGWWPGTTFKFTSEKRDVIQGMVT
jgi:hypothetical protein